MVKVTRGQSKKYFFHNCVYTVEQNCVFKEHQRLSFGDAKTFIFTQECECYVLCKEQKKVTCIVMIFQYAVTEVNYFGLHHA